MKLSGRGVIHTTIEGPPHVIPMVRVGGWGLPATRREAPPYFTKSQIVKVFDQVAILLELDGANPFRVRAYQNASRALGQMNRHLIDVIQSNELTEIKGIGKGLSSLITDVVMNGEWGDIQSLFDRVPPGLVEMVDIPGLGPKRARVLSEELGVASIESLKSACEKNLVATLQGFGEKSQQRYLEGIELFHRNQGRTRLDVGLRFGLALEKRISEISGVEKAQLAGSARRRRETIGDLDIVVSTHPKNSTSVIQSILELPGIADIKGYGKSKISLILEQSVLDSSFPTGSIDDALNEAILDRSEDATIDAQVRIVSPETFPFTLAYFTGSKEHNIRMRKIAIDNGLRLNEFGLIPERLAGDLKGVDAAVHTLSCESEEEIYSKLGLQWVTPELREDMGEIEAASRNEIPGLIEPNMIRGALHNHTVASDGSGTLEEMASAAINLGWEYLGIAEHSPALNIGGRSIGVDPVDVSIQGDLIRGLNQKWEDEGENFRMFHGTECDILPDGKLDYSPDIRSQFHHVIGSVHALGSWRSRDEQDNTDAIIKAVEDPSFTILGHPTGRILQAREGFPIDMVQIIEKMGEINSNGKLKAIEINASPYRLDLDWRLCKVAKENGVPIVINPDAHSVEGLSDVSYGVDIARKGWLCAEDVLNTRSAVELDQILSR